MRQHDYHGKNWTGCLCCSKHFSKEGAARRRQTACISYVCAMRQSTEISTGKLSQKTKGLFKGELKLTLKYNGVRTFLHTDKRFVLSLWTLAYSVLVSVATVFLCYCSSILVMACSSQQTELEERESNFHPNSLPTLPLLARHFSAIQPVLSLGPNFTFVDPKKPGSQLSMVRLRTDRLQICERTETYVMP